MSAETPMPDPRFLGGEKWMKVTNVGDEALVVVVDWNGAADIHSRQKLAQIIAILRQIADSLEAKS